MLMGVLAPSAQAQRVPFGWVGTVVDGPVLNPQVDFDHESSIMTEAGVESMRGAIDWRWVQPYGSWDDVPATERARFRDEGGVPTDFTLPDQLVGTAAKRDMKLLPIILYSPAWAARYPGEFGSPPKGTANYARFAGTLARRYGPTGSFWTENPELPWRPLRTWQIWNEPSLEAYWKDDPWEADYVALLRAARLEIKRVDPKAKMVLAGLPNKSWADLQSIYKVRGARRYFDAVALHPFTARVDGVIKIIRKARAVMRKRGDRKKPVFVTEMSWPSAGKKTSNRYGIETSEEGQATKLRKALRMLAKRRKGLRLQGVFWYTWMTADRRADYPFDYAGLNRFENGEVVRKPAYRALRSTALRLRGCTSKPSGARSCLR